MGPFNAIMIVTFVALVPPDLYRRAKDRLVARFAARGVSVLYDGACGICRASRARLEALDLLRRLVFVDIRDSAAMARLPRVRMEDAERTMHTLAPDGSLALGFGALRRIAREGPLLWLALPLLYAPGVAPLGERVYGWIARNRFRLSHCPDGACAVHARGLGPAPKVGA